MSTRRNRPAYTTLKDEVAWIANQGAAIEKTLEPRPDRPTRLEPIYETGDSLAAALQRRGLMSYEAMHDLGPQHRLRFTRDGEPIARVVYDYNRKGEPLVRYETEHVAVPGPESWQWLRRKEQLRASARAAAEACVRHPRFPLYELQLEHRELTERLDRWVCATERVRRRHPEFLSELRAEQEAFKDRLFAYELYQTVKRLAPKKPLATRECKRFAIEMEIRRVLDAGVRRSDREIARVVSREFGTCDHKTVGSVRRELEGESATAAQVSEIKQHVDQRFDELAQLFVGTVIAQEGHPAEAAEEILSERVSPPERP
jgi:hypothetical protein